MTEVSEWVTLKCTSTELLNKLKKELNKETYITVLFYMGKHKILGSEAKLENYPH